MKEAVKIMIVGNGFDLAHGLPTTYKDFLVSALNERAELLTDTEKWFLETKNHHTIFEKTDNAYKFCVKNVTDNSCIQTYSLKDLFVFNGDWIDIESNMESCILCSDEEYAFLTELYDEFLLLGFEHYIAEHINKLNIEPVFDVDIFSDCDLIISFNHSNTIERLYNPSCEICYVNGKAQVNANNPNIVFGCDCFIKGDDEGVKYSLFDKESQRNYRNVDTSYKEFLRDVSRERIITVIGHSLGETDHIILKPLLANFRLCTATIYYHTDTAQHQLRHRMMSMAGKGFLDKYNVQFRDITEIKRILR